MFTSILAAKPGELTEPRQAAPAQRHGSARATAIFIVAACCAAFLVFGNRSAIPDIAWLIEASRRWMSGAELYVDIIEVNPPLVFYETVLLSGGLLTTRAYFGGVCVVMALSALWALRLRGPYIGLVSLAAMVFGGMTDFGQREHLALIFIIPFLLGEGAGRRERVALGLWAFLGVGLKPYLLPIPLAAAIVRAVLSRSIRPVFSAQMVALGLACSAYVLAVLALHPTYLRETVPLGQFVYWAYEIPLHPTFLGLSGILIFACPVAFAAGDREKMPLAAAVLGALASFYVQGRYFTYHFVPATGLGILLILWRRKAAEQLLAAALVAFQMLRGPHPEERSPIPVGVKSVAFLIQHVVGAYPSALNCGVRNTTRYPAIWVIPGAWNILHDSSRSPADRARARDILARERQIIRGDLLRERPELIFVDKREVKPYFQHPFDYERFLGPLPGYRYIHRRGAYAVYSRVGVPSSELCDKRA